MASISPTTRKRQLQQQPPGAVSVGRSNNYSINVNSFAHTSILSPDHKLLSGGPPTPGQSFGTQGPLLPIRGPRSKLLFQRTSSMPLFAASPSLENLNAVQGDVQNYCHQLIEQCIEEQNEYIDLSCLSLLHIPDVIENLKFIPISKCKLHLLDRLLDSRCGGDLLTSTDGSVAHTGVLSSTSTQTGSLAPRLQVYLQGNNLTEINTKLFSVTNIQILSIRKDS